MPELESISKQKQSASSVCLCRPILVVMEDKRVDEENLPKQSQTELYTKHRTGLATVAVAHMLYVQNFRLHIDS